MITINDKDLPITAAEKLITATHVVELNDGISLALCKAFKTDGNVDQFTVDELEEIAMYLLVYCKQYRKAEGND